jgi:glycosyltransferase involved in cell wall biosynthesis
MVALASRLRAVAPAIGDARPGAAADGAEGTLALLEGLAESVKATPAPNRVWLLLTAVSASMPTTEQVTETIRYLSLESPPQTALWLLQQAMQNRSSASAAKGLRLVTNRVVVDVHHAATHELHTGMQQVVRNAVPAWVRAYGALPVAWNEGYGHYRVLSDAETSRALHRNGSEVEVTTEGPAGEMILPWRTPVLLAEVPPVQACDRLSALARFSANPVVLIGYDCIPVVSGDLVPEPEAPRFVRYLSIVKYSRRVAAISESARAEFAGFTATLAAQGLTGPTVAECSLPAEELLIPSVDSEAADVGSVGRPLVLSVGSFEPRKNHLSLLYAAERLWREGHHFELLLLGGSGWGQEIPKEIAKLRRLGRPVEARHRVSDSNVASAYRRARFTVFTSLHEGYGLPVAESLAYGTPVITSGYGSTSEIAKAGGALLVDPRDDEELVRAMRQLLTDDRQLASLQEQIASRPQRTWEGYAGDLWNLMVAPELDGGLENDHP